MQQELVEERAMQARAAEACYARSRAFVGPGSGEKAAGFGAGLVLSLGVQLLAELEAGP